MKRLIVLLPLLALMLVAPARAEGLDAEQYDLFGASEVDESIPDEAQDILGDVGVKDALEPEGLFSRLWSALGERLRGLWGEAAAGAVKLLAVAALISACSAFATDASRRYVSIAGCLAVAGVAFGDASAWINTGAETIEELNLFSHALLPCLAATAAAGGSAAGAR